MKKIKIGICGWGTVATALHRSILENKNQIKRTHQVDLEIVAIGARRDNPKYSAGETKILRNIFDVLKEDIDVELHDMVTKELFEIRETRRSIV